MRTAGADDHLPDELLESPCGGGFTTVSYRFQADAALREEYQNPWGYLRHGKLFEDVDALAGTIANRHCADSNLHLVSCANNICICCSTAAGPVPRSMLLHSLSPHNA